MTIQELKARKAQLEREKDQLVANLNAHIGRIAEVNDQIVAAEKEESPKPQQPTPETPCEQSA